MSAQSERRMPTAGTRKADTRYNPSFPLSNPLVLLPMLPFESEFSDVREIGDGKSTSSLLRAFLRRPLQTGTLVESGHRLCRELVSKARVDSAGVVVEFGAGTGAVTADILQFKPGESLLISYELDEQLAAIAGHRCPRAQVINGDAANAPALLKSMQIDSCDAVISSIPWANLANSVQDNLLDSAAEILAPGGHFVTYAYLHGKPFPKARNFYRKLQARFDVVNSGPVIWANMPPAIVYHATNYPASDK